MSRVRVPCFVAVLFSPFYILAQLISIPVRIFIALANAANRSNRRREQKRNRRY